MVFPAIDLNVSPKWEINFGVGVGATASTDHWIVKGILGRRFDWGGERASSLLAADSRAVCMRQPGIRHRRYLSPGV